MRAARKQTLYVTSVNISPRKRFALSTNCPIDDEIFASLAYLSEIPEVGKTYLKKYIQRPDQIDLAFSLFKAYVRQARTFYESARTLHHRASPLNYYYSFLNLAKCFICITNPIVVGNRINHGLSYSLQKDELRKQQVSVNSHQGVFHLLYEKLAKQNINQPLNLNLAKLLGYCTDISYEYVNSGFGERKLIPVRANISGNSDTKKSFVTIAASGIELLNSYPITRNIFEGFFEEVEIHKDLVKECFDIHAKDTDNLKFYESKKEYDLVENDRVSTKLITEECYGVLAPVFMSNPYSGDIDFFISLPYAETPYTPFNEILAIYVTMYFLGSLVRYYPFYLEEILQSKEAWLIERFIESTPSTFLRHISNLILDEDRIYSIR